MAFREALDEQLRLHKAMQPADIVKLLYQSIYGKEHLLSSDTVKYFYEEYRDTPVTDEPLHETVSDTAIRVNLGAWKREGLSSAWLINMFMLNQQDFFPSDDGLFLSSLHDVRSCLACGNAPFPVSEWDRFEAEYLGGGIRPLHHSSAYRSCEMPHYRVLPAIDLAVIRILSEIRKTGASVIAIDGRAASGKTTVAGILSAALGGAGIVRMDDFFLPYGMRTSERLSSPGGNVHYERFAAEVLPYIRGGSEFSYGRFDCSSGSVNSRIHVPSGEYRIVEGSYSAHPAFGIYWDLLVFSDISYEEQLRRIEKRNGKEMEERFISEWIPMEELYFSSFGIRSKASLIL